MQELELTGIAILGDSIMKATSPDEKQRLHFYSKAYLERFTKQFSVKIANLAHFGATITRGCRDLQTMLREHCDCSHVLLEYGGNDCDFDWAAIAEDPAGTHLPKTPLPQFLETLSGMVSLLRQKGKTPVLMTLPPIDAERYLGRIAATEQARKSILSWLGDTQMIYRFHEMYSNAIAQFASAEALPLLQVRQRFLGKHNFKELISSDGVHPTLAGYDVIYEAAAEFLAGKLGRRMSGLLPSV